MNTLDLIVIWLNLAGCVAAIPINLHAARVGFLIHPGLARTIAVVAGIYAVGYVMLHTGTVHVAAWSDFYRGVSVVVWPLVWVIAPFLLTVVGVLPGSFAGISTNQGVGDQLLTSVFVAGTWWTACLSAQLLIYIPDRVAWLVAPDAEAPSEPVAESDSSDEPAA